MNNKKCVDWFSAYLSYIRFVGIGEDKLPQSDDDSIDVLANDEQLSTKIISVEIKFVKI